MVSMVQRKYGKQLNREGINVGHCTVRRIMKSEGLSGARRGCQFKVTTISAEGQHRPSDLVDRQFVAPAPNRLWVADLTYVKTHSGWVYVAFIIDVFSRFIVPLVRSPPHFVVILRSMHSRWRSTHVTETTCRN
jgi:putative transposase